MSFFLLFIFLIFLKSSNVTRLWQLQPEINTNKHDRYKILYLVPWKWNISLHFNDIPVLHSQNAKAGFQTQPIGGVTKGKILEGR